METHGEKSSEGYSPTPEPGTPDFVNVFMTDRVAKTPFDGNECSKGKSNDTPGTVAYMPVKMNSHLYNMNHEHRGKCSVFSYETLQYQSSDYRYCSSLHASRIEQTFRKLGFDVEILKNLSWKKIMKKIIELSEANHENSDCICIFMLIHDEPVEMWTTLGADHVIYGDNEIWKPFTGDNCKTLAGKPKLFFFQICGGDRFVSLGPQRASRQMRTKADPFSYTIPIYADFLISHSMITGFCSWRNEIEREWFVPCLCDVLDQYADTTDLLKMLTITARKVATPFNVVSNDEQVPSTMSMLLRDVYFTPKHEYPSERSENQ